MADPFSEETQALLDAADRAIVCSRDIINQGRSAMAECQRRRRVQAVRLAFLREIGEPK
jgi:hypothetical protein